MAFEIRYLVKNLKHGSKPFAVYKEIHYDTGGIRQEFVEAFRMLKTAEELAERLNLKSDD